MKFESLRQHLYISLFITIQLSIVAYSLNLNLDTRRSRDEDLSNKSKEQSISLVTDVNYFKIKNYKKVVNLVSSKLSSESVAGKTNFENPRGKAFTKSGELLHFSSELGTYDNNTELLELREQVDLKTQGSQLKADKLVYEKRNDKIWAIGKVKTRSRSEQTGDQILIDAASVETNLANRRSNYRTNVKGQIKRKRKYEPNLFFESQELKLDLNASKIELNEDVSVKKQELRASSRRGEVFLENYNKKLKYYTLFDDVKVIEKVMLDGSSYLRKAFAERLEGIVSENKIVLSGYPRVYQKKDVIKGNRITLRENVEVVEVDDANTNFTLERGQ